jgi:hypothetical protein
MPRVRLAKCKKDYICYIMHHDKFHVLRYELRKADYKVTNGVLGMLTVTQLVKEFPTFCGTGMFITVFTTAHLILSSDRWSQSTSLHHIPLRSSLILSSTWRWRFSVSPLLLIQWHPCPIWTLVLTLDPTYICLILLLHLHGVVLRKKHRDNFTFTCSQWTWSKEAYGISKYTNSSRWEVISLPPHSPSWKVTSYRLSFDIFPAALHTLKAVSCIRNLRTHHAVVTETHITKLYK